MRVKSESEVAQSCPTAGDPMGCSLPGSSAVGFSRQEYWSGCRCLLRITPVTSLQTVEHSLVNTVLWGGRESWGSRLATQHAPALLQKRVSHLDFLFLTLSPGGMSSSSSPARVWAPPQAPCPQGACGMMDKAVSLTLYRKTQPFLLMSQSCEVGSREGLG